MHTVSIPTQEPANLSTFLPRGSPWYPRSSPSSYPGNPQTEHHRDNLRQWLNTCQWGTMLQMPILWEDCFGKVCSMWFLKGSPAESGPSCPQWKPSHLLASLPLWVLMHFSQRPPKVAHPQPKASLLFLGCCFLYLVCKSTPESTLMIRRIDMSTSQDIPHA